MNRIAIIGWGSLLWDLDDLAPRVAGGWRMGAGPRLPMEFSRVSPKRRQALVVCLDLEHGVDCVTHVITSIRPDMAAAVSDLAARERAPEERIGFADTSGQSFGRMPDVCREVTDWCVANNWDAAVWTDLEPNFEAETGREFSVESGTKYLRKLHPESLLEAVAYINNAPQATMTPLRETLNADPWWRGLR